MAFTPNQQAGRRIGVNTGGTQGRLGAMHMGVASKAGGRNTKGSGIPPRNPFVARPVASGSKPGLLQQLTRPKPKPRPSSLRPLERPGMKPSPRPTSRPGTKPATAAPATPASPAPVAPPTDPLDYRSQSSYIAAMAGLNHELAGDRRGLQSQLAENARLYGQAVGDSRRAAEDHLRRQHADLAARGLSSSGMREDTDADRFRDFDRHMADIEMNLGSGATARINAALARLEEQEAFERQRIEAQARDEWGELYPAAPIAEETPAAGPSPAAPAVARPVAKPRFPGAKTFTDALGNVREVGTGRIIRRSGIGTVPAGTPAPVGMPVKPRVPPRNPAARR